MELWRKLVVLCALAVMAVLTVGSGLIDGYHYVATRAEAVETTAAVRKTNADAILVEYRWEGQIRTAWTDRVAAEPPTMNRFVPILVDPDDPDRVTMPEWIDRAPPRILGRIGFGLLIALGAALLLRHMLREEEPERPILRPRAKRRPQDRRRSANRQLRRRSR